RSSCTGRTNLQTCRTNFASQPLNVGDGTRTGSRQPKVGSIDLKRVHQVEDAQLVINRRVGDRRRLKAIAKSLVGELNLVRRPLEAVTCAIPVVDQGLLHETDYTA